jgi:hypothetical protein
MLAEFGAEHEVQTDTLPNRRFSGDGLLSRSRYYSLCQPDGTDGGTIRREVAAYHDPITRAPIKIEDVFAPTTKRVQRARQTRRPRFCESQFLRSRPFSTKRFAISHRRVRRTLFCL